VIDRIRSGWKRCVIPGDYCTFTIDGQMSIQELIGSDSGIYRGDPDPSNIDSEEDLGVMIMSELH